MFNLYRQSNQAIQPTEVSLEDQRSEESNKPYNSLLEEVRKNKEGAKVVAIEGELKGVHTEKGLVSTTESQLEDYKPEKGMPQRTGDDAHDQLPINLLEEKSHQAKIKAFKNNTLKDKDTAFWDEILTSSDIKGTPTQLHNHNTRFKNLTEDDILKNQGVKDMVMASLKDADAMLYHIYRVASSEGRNLSDKETTLVNGITADKIKHISKYMQK